MLYFSDPFKGIETKISMYSGDINAQDRDGKTVFHHLVTSTPTGKYFRHYQKCLNAEILFLIGCCVLIPSTFSLVHVFPHDHR